MLFSTRLRSKGDMAILVETKADGTKRENAQRRHSIKERIPNRTANGRRAANGEFLYNLNVQSSRIMQKCDNSHSPIGLERMSPSHFMRIDLGCEAVPDAMTLRKSGGNLRPKKPAEQLSADLCLPPRTCGMKFKNGTDIWSMQAGIRRDQWKRSAVLITHYFPCTSDNAQMGRMSPEEQRCGVSLKQRSSARAVASGGWR